MKKLIVILLFAVLLVTAVSASEMVNLTAFPDESTIISTPKYEGITYPVKYANGIYGNNARLTADIVSTAELTAAEKADLANIDYGVSAIGVKNFGTANALRNLVDGNWDGTSKRMANINFDDNMYDIDGTVNNESGKYRALITLNFGTKYRFDAVGFISATNYSFFGATDVYVSSDGVNWKLVPTASYDKLNGDTFVDLVEGDVKVPADTWTGYTDVEFATLFDMGDIEGQYIRFGVITGKTLSEKFYNNVNIREIIVYGEQTGKDNRSSRTDILFVGNSFTFTYSIPESLFMPIARSSGYNVFATSITKGAHWLYRHSTVHEEMGAQVHAALTNYVYDYVVFQDQSTSAITEPELFYTAVRRMTRHVRESGATPILYATWGHEEGSEMFDRENMIGLGLNTESMTYGMTAGYHAIAKELGVSVSNVGLAFWDVFSNHGDTIRVHGSDHHHPSKLGSYLSAMTHFANILGGNPLNCEYNAGHPAATTAILKQAAYDATYNTPAIPAEYVVSSVGIGTDGYYGIDLDAIKPLSKLPSSNLLTAYKVGGTVRSLTGDKGIVASPEFSGEALTPEQKADLADIGYGISAIGIESMLNTATDFENAMTNLVDGKWATSNPEMASFVFDDNKYDIDGTVNNEDGRYRALFTFNFGSKHRFDACGFYSSNALGFAGVAEVFVSDDGVNWTYVPSASYDGINAPFINLSPKPKDVVSGGTIAFNMLHSMEGVTGKYVRLGIIEGRYNLVENYNTINTREFAIYGERCPFFDADNDGVTGIRDLLMLADFILDDEPYHMAMDTNYDGKVSLADILTVAKELVK